MNVLDSGNLNTILFGALFMGIIFLISFIRNMETKRIRNIVGEDKILLSAFNVHFYGVESVPGKILNSMGALALSSDGVYYRARYAKRELFIPGRQISSITATDDFKNKNMYGNVFVINFVNQEGKRDRAAFRIPYPERWSKAINQLFVNNS